MAQSRPDLQVPASDIVVLVGFSSRSDASLEQEGLVCFLSQNRPLQYRCCQTLMRLWVSPQLHGPCICCCWQRCHSPPPISPSSASSPFACPPFVQCHTRPATRTGGGADAAGGRGTRRRHVAVAVAVAGNAVVVAGGRRAGAGAGGEEEGTGTRAAIRALCGAAAHGVGASGGGGGVVVVGASGLVQRSAVPHRVEGPCALGGSVEEGGTGAAGMGVQRGESGAVGNGGGGGSANGCERRSAAPVGSRRRGWRKRRETRHPMRTLLLWATPLELQMRSIRVQRNLRKTRENSPGRNSRGIGRRPLRRFWSWILPSRGLIRYTAVARKHRWSFLRQSGPSRCGLPRKERRTDWEMASVERGYWMADACFPGGRNPSLWA